jgi:hypothetical protein
VLLCAPLTPRRRVDNSQSNLNKFRSFVFRCERSPSLQRAVSRRLERERQDFSEEAEKIFQKVVAPQQTCGGSARDAAACCLLNRCPQTRQSWLKATSSEDIKEWYR